MKTVAEILDEIENRPPTYLLTDPVREYTIVRAERDRCIAALRAVVSALELPPVSAYTRLILDEAEKKLRGEK